MGRNGLRIRLIGRCRFRHEFRQAGDSRRHLVRCLYMSFQGYRFQSETARINIQVLVCHKEKMVFTRCTQTSQAGKGHRLPNLQHFLHFREEISQNARGRLLVESVGLGVQVRQQGVCPLAGRKIQPPIRRIHGIPFV